MGKNTNPWSGLRKPRTKCNDCDKLVVARLDGSLRPHLCRDGYVTPPPSQAKPNDEQTAT